MTDDPKRRLSTSPSYNKGEWRTRYDHPDDDEYPAWMVTMFAMQEEKFQAAKRALIQTWDMMLDWKWEEDQK